MADQGKQQRTAATPVGELEAGRPLRVDEFFEAATRGVLRAIDAQRLLKVEKEQEIVDHRIFVGIWAERIVPQAFPGAPNVPQIPGER
jgi:hypothetical protein